MPNASDDGQRRRGERAYDARTSVADLDREHFSAQLLERLSGTVGDAHATEQAQHDQRDDAPCNAGGHDRHALARALLHGHEAIAVERGCPWRSSSRRLSAGC